MGIFDDEDGNQEPADEDAGEPSIGSKPRRTRKKQRENETSELPAVNEAPEVASKEAVTEPVPGELTAKPPPLAPPPAPSQPQKPPAGDGAGKPAEPKAAEPTAEGANKGVRRLSSIEDIDDLLDKVDPQFSADLKKINAEDFKGVSIDEARTEQADENIKVKHFRLQWFTNLPQQVKLIYVGSLLIFLFFTPLLILVLNKSLLPSFNLPYVLSFHELSEEVYPYDPGGPTVPLFDDFRTKAFTLPLPRTTINLRSDEGQPAFGHFEFFLVVRDEELAKIIADKQSEVIDLIQRTLEQVSWNEMQSPIGKEKVKKVLRHLINEYFQSNIVLGVYYRSILLSK